MGIFWSCCEDNEEVCIRCSRRGLELTNNECQFCRISRLAVHVPSTFEVHVQRSFQAPRPTVPRSTQGYRPPAKVATPQPAYVIPKKDKRCPLFGEFRCSCGRRWKSRRSWHQKRQTCQECNKKVYAHTQRELRPEDMEERSREAGMLDHREDLCEMCQELGYYCGRYKY